MILEQIKEPENLKNMSPEELCVLAGEIRTFLIEKISHTGGHLASNLGVVELTIALLRTFDLPKDKIIWDVGHQSYTHKILSGRMQEFDELRQYGGLSGFPKRKESPYDAFDTGHSSTSISAGLGIAQGRDILGEDYKVVSVIGDGALTGGMAYEALNNAARMKKNFIIVLNDNKMSISENVGGMSRYLGGLRTGNGYNDLKKNVADTLERIPVVGERMIDRIKRTKNSIKQLFIPGMLFENMGITYLGPVDGHNIQALCKVFKEAQKLPQVERVKQSVKISGCPMPCFWEDDSFDFDKFYIGSDEKSRCKELFGRMPDMEVIDRENGFYECIPRGHSKATAIDLVLKHCGIGIEDAYVFGDSSNDLSMFRYAENCVVMGDHSPVLELYATFITKTVEDDGIAYAMKELGII